MCIIYIMSEFNVYRCPDPLKSYTSQPWYRFTDICPCDPKDSNITGRGFTSCPFGVSDNSKYQSFQNTPIPQRDIPVGNIYPQQQYVPPQLEPRQLVRIGQQWRSGN